jgi:ribosomal protein S27AE
MADFFPIVRRWCPKCQEPFDATQVIRRVGKEQAPTEETGCPKCGAAGELLADVPPRVRR